MENKRAKHIYGIRILILGVAFSVSVLVWGMLWYGKATTCDLRSLCVAFLDVGQGDAIFIQSPSGMQMLVDGGKDRSVVGQLPLVMESSDRSIDVVVATHPDVDHIGGLMSVFERYDVGTFVQTNMVGDTEAAKDLQTYIDTKNYTKRTVSFGDTIDLGSGVVVTVISPDRDVRNMDTNEGSIVLHVRYGKSDFILTGDAPTLAEYRILKNINNEALGAEVVKVGHHGSRTSSGDRFVAATHPGVAVISAGVNNSYGHPHMEVIERYVSRGARVVSTAENGTLVFETDGEEIRLRSMRGH